MRSDAHGVGRFRQQRKVGESTKLDFLDSVPICWGVNFGNSSSALYYFVMTAYTPADFSDGLVGLAHSQGMWVRGNHTANGQCGITALRF